LRGSYKFKREICAENGITLIEIFYDEEITKSLIKNKITIAGINTKHNGYASKRTIHKML